MKPIAITIGDVAGIGPEIIAKAFRDAPELTQDCVVLGDASVMQQAARQVGLAPEAIPVQTVETPLPLIAPGQISAIAGRHAAACVRQAARGVLKGEFSAMVTAPLHKEALAAAGEPFPGHTEMLQHEAALHLKCDVSQVPVRMMLANESLKTVLVSIHMSLRQAIEAVTTANVLQTIELTQAFYQHHGKPTPRIAVAGLNPHAGEGGLFGSEELDIIIPAITQAQAQGINAQGPLAPDTVFMRAREGEFDVVIAMYHDQGLIPVKYLGLQHGINITLGLPLIRTSPDHGTAFDIAGQNQADASSLIAALREARALVE